MNQTNFQGQSLIEYALLLVLISIVVIVALTALGPAISNALYQNIINGI
jgi:Flp pilus assembly pilin Flp